MVRKLEYKTEHPKIRAAIAAMGNDNGGFKFGETEHAAVERIYRRIRGKFVWQKILSAEKYLEKLTGEQFDDMVCGDGDSLHSCRALGPDRDSQFIRCKSIMDFAFKELI